MADPFAHVKRAGGNVRPATIGAADRQDEVAVELKPEIGEHGAGEYDLQSRIDLADEQRVHPHRLAHHQERMTAPTISTSRETTRITSQAGKSLSRPNVT